MILLQVVADGRLGGGTTHVLQLIEALAAALPGEVHLVSQEGSPALVEAARLGAVTHGLDFFSARLDPRIWLGLRALLRRLRPALIHAHGARAGLPLAALAGPAPERPPTLTLPREGGGKNSGSPVLLVGGGNASSDPLRLDGGGNDSSDPLPREGGGRGGGETRRRPRLLYSVHGYHFVGKQGPLRRLALAAERFCAARADLTLFVCQHDRALAEDAGILRRCRRHRVVPNGIDLAGLPPARGTPGGRTLGFLGRLEAVKNPLLALEVLAALRDADFRLVVIGDGPLMTALRARAAALGLADRVELAGSLPRPAALERLAALDVLLVPSLWEGMPLAPLEAMAIGVPVIASRVGGLPEIIADGEMGVLIDGHDPSHYAEAVRRLTDDAAWRAGIVARARADVAERFSWAAARRAYLELYREALARP